MTTEEHSVRVETDRPRMPEFCICCGAPATDVHRPEPPGRMKGMPQPDEPLIYPYCADCKVHLRAAQDRKSSNLVAINFAIWGVGLPLAIGLPAVALVVGPTIGGLIYARNRKSDLRTTDACSAEGVAARVSWVRKHTYEFSFTRKETAQAFVELNRDSLSDR